MKRLVFTVAATVTVDVEDDAATDACITAHQDAIPDSLQIASNIEGGNITVDRVSFAAVVDAVD